MNRAGLIGTIIWIVILFLLISGAFFYFSLKDFLFENESVQENFTEETENEFNESFDVNENIGIIKIEDDKSD